MSDSQGMIKAASVLLALERRQSVKLLEALPGDLVARIVEYSGGKQTMTARQAQEALSAFCSEMVERHPGDAQEILAHWLGCSRQSAEVSADGAVPGGEAFERLIEKNDAYIETLIRNSHPKMLALALRGASEKCKEKFFRNMTLRVLREIKSFIDLMRIARTEDMLKAQQAVLQNRPAS